MGERIEGAPGQGVVRTRHVGKLGTWMTRSHIIRELGNDVNDGKDFPENAADEDDEGSTGVEKERLRFCYMISRYTCLPVLYSSRATAEGSRSYSYEINTYQSRAFR